MLQIRRLRYSQPADALCNVFAGANHATHSPCRIEYLHAQYALVSNLMGWLLISPVDYKCLSSLRFLFTSFAYEKEVANSFRLKRAVSRPKLPPG